MKKGIWKNHKKIFNPNTEKTYPLANQAKNKKKPYMGGATVFRYKGIDYTKLSQMQDTTEILIPVEDLTNKEYQDLIKRTAIQDELDHGMLRMQLREILLNAIETLDRKSRNILLFRFYDNRTLQYIADIYKCTRENIRQIETKALKKLCQIDTLKYYCE